MHNEELCDSYRTRSVVVTLKSRRLWLVGSPTRRWEENIKMNLKEIPCCQEMDGSGLGSCPTAGFHISEAEPWGLLSGSYSAVYPEMSHLWNYCLPIISGFP
jgi:hypothetical protein